MNETLSATHRPRINLRRRSGHAVYSSLFTLLLLAGTAHGQFVQATGGDITNTIIGSDGYYWKVHTFTNSGSFNVTAGGTVEYLVIGGGGGGGWGDSFVWSCGGGAGGYRSSCSAPGELSGSNSPPESPLTVVAGSNYTVTIGAGGPGGNPDGTNGADSVFGPIVASGGGYGARNTQGGNGGCGGGGYTAGRGTACQGFDGAADNSSNGAGGGGAGSKGGPNVTPGTGLASKIDFYPGITRAAGGTASLVAIVNGAPNTGDGGSGAKSGNGGSGGSGIVIVRYRASPPPPGPKASGGTVTNYFSTNGMDLALHVFSNSANFVVTSPGYVDVLVVGGGGGGGPSTGGGWCTGGGGAGGMLEVCQYAVTAGTYSVSVGGGGSGGQGDSAGFQANTSGTNSSFGDLTAYGGGRGGFGGNLASQTPGDGGSGGGSGAYRVGGACTNGQGNIGGDDAVTYGGGGGGAGAAGGAGSAGGGGVGGSGRGSYITGTAVTYAGGGGGCWENGLGGAGGAGGGGAGAVAGSPNGVAGTDGLGGGGGGAVLTGGIAGNGGNGGKGIVIVRYRIAPPSGTMLMLR